MFIVLGGSSYRYGKMISQRERDIGVRLRAFREGLLIPRSRFAVKVGFGSERIASYESGRAPLPFSVFKSIYTHYALNPVWLAEGKGGPTAAHDCVDQFAEAIHPRALFTEIYDNCLKRACATESQKALREANGKADDLYALVDSLSDPEIAKKFKELSPEAFSKLAFALEKVGAAMRGYERMKQTVESKLPSRLNPKRAS